MKRLGYVIAIMGLMTGCITTEDSGFVNYQDIEGVFGTKPQAVEYKEVGPVHSSAKNFFWVSCDNVCKDAVNKLKVNAKSLGADSVIDVHYKNDDGFKTQTPTCLTTWGWALWTHGLGLVAPWIQKCSVEGIAISQKAAKK